MPKIGEKTFDIRTTERALHRGTLKKSEYEKQLKSLPDDSENAMETRPGDPEFELAGKSSES